MEIVTVEHKDHDKVVLTRESGDTYTSKSEELMDFLHGVNKNFVLADVVKTLPLDFVKWYSGMEQQKILTAYERWKKESGNVL